MTAAEFRAKLRALGLTPARNTYNGGAIYQDRAGDFHNVPDPDTLTSEQREALIALFEGILGT